MCSGDKHAHTKRSRFGPEVMKPPPKYEKCVNSFSFKIMYQTNAIENGEGCNLN